MACLHLLITGASRGLGLGLVEHCLGDGHQVWAMVRRSSEALAALGEKHAGRLHCVEGDVSDIASVGRALTAVGSQTTHLDVLINNAGMDPEKSGARIDDVDFSEFAGVFAVNSTGPMVVAQQALPLLRAGGKKLIVNVSSTAGAIGAQTWGAAFAYCMSKAALNMGGRILGNALRDEEIRVLAVHPGWFSSEMGGADAPITPSEAAEVLMDTLIRAERLPEGDFLGPDGEALAW